MNKCSKIKKKIIEIISASGAVHIASSLSCVEILVSIYDSGSQDYFDKKYKLSLKSIKNFIFKK